jgi:hypothetical protein
MSPFLRWYLSLFGTEIYTFHHTWAQEGYIFYRLRDFCLYHTYINLYKYRKAPKFCLKSFFNVHAMSLALNSSMWHSVTQTKLPKFCYFEEKVYPGRWHFSFPSLPLVVPPCHNFSDFNQTHINSFHLSYLHPINWLQRIFLYQVDHTNLYNHCHYTSCYLSNSLYKLTHTNLINNCLLHKLVPIKWYHHQLLYKLVPINWYHRSFYKLAHIHWYRIMNYYDITNEICKLVDETHEWSSTILLPDGDKCIGISSAAMVRHQILWPMPPSSLMYIPKGRQHLSIVWIRIFMMKILGWN